MMLDIESLITSVSVRIAGESDLAEVVAMHERCTPRTRYSRYLTGSGVPAGLRGLLAPANGYTLVATLLGGADDGRVLAAANLIGTGPGTAEIAILVEDRWQRAGIGTELTRRLTDRAARDGITSIAAHMLADNRAVRRTIQRLVDDGTLSDAAVTDRDGPTITMTLRPSGRTVRTTPWTTDGTAGVRAAAVPALG